MAMTKSSGTDSKNARYCSFCGKSQHEVRKLIAGPTVLPARTSVSKNGFAKIATSIGSSPATFSAILATVPYST